MAKYTMELGDIVESGYPVFDFDYPCIAGYRSTFENKFILNFYDREINYLTVDEFKRHLKARLNLIMPYYVQLQKSEHLIDNPFRTYKMAESTKRADDDDVWFKSIDTAALTDGVVTNRGENFDLISVEGVGQKETGNKDGTLNRNTAGKENTKHINDKTENEQTTLNRTITEHEDSTKDITKDTTYEEDSKGSKTTLFSDTPQENFVIGDVDEHGNPISAYATTYTQENTTNHKEGNQHDVTNEHLIGDKDSEQNDKTNRELITGQNEKTNTKTTQVQDDVTHEEYTDNLDRQTDTKQNTKTSQQEKSDRITENTDIRKTNRVSRAQAITDYGYEGYKQITESQMLKAFRDTFLNIDKEIFRDCETLFLGIY